MKLAWTPEAIADRAAIYDYIEADNPRAALELDEQFARRASQLLIHPLIGRSGRVPFTRELVVRPDYLLVMTWTVRHSESFVSCTRLGNGHQKWNERCLTAATFYFPLIISPKA